MRKISGTRTEGATFRGSSNASNSINELACFKEYKAHSWSRLVPAPGKTFLDVACGAGFDVGGMASRWPLAHFVGVDRSERFLDLARTRYAGFGNVEFVSGDARTLPFENASFDGARIDRSLQHIAQPESVIEEMKRVVRPGGRIVLSEPDWGTFVLENGDDRVSRIIAKTWASLFVNPHIGRQLAERAANAGLRVAATDIGMLKVDNYQDAEVVFDLRNALKRCFDEGVIGAEDSDRWIERSSIASERRAFLSMLCIVTVTAERGS